MKKLLKAHIVKKQKKQLHRVAFGHGVKCLHEGELPDVSRAAS